MFTGIIEATGRVLSVDPIPAGVRLNVDAPDWGFAPAVGESIAVNGCCLTQAQAGPAGRLAFDVIPETLARTNLGALRAGSRVNLERAATAASLIGGHVVQGHVDALAEVVSIRTEGEWRVRLRLGAEAMEYIVPKGCVAIDGVSLTIAAVDVAERAFEVALIPTTLAKTIMGQAKAGSTCNIETDVMARTVVHWLRNYRDVTR